jgi:hypothetical protein
MVTQLPAPVAVPPSGVMVTPPTAERRAVATELVKTGQKERTPAKAAPSMMRRCAAMSCICGRIDEIGYEAFLTQIGKAKQAK